MVFMGSKVSIVKCSDRADGAARAIDLLGINPVEGKAVLVKPNFNTADPFPASTHNDTLCALLLKLRAMGAASLTVGERSGPPRTSDVLADMGVPALLEGMGVALINFEDLPQSQWELMSPAGSHWRRGFHVARPVLDAQAVVAICCLKTHRYGGVFTMSLKLAIGITHKDDMLELHSSMLSMRKMIAEVNTAYKPCLVLMDAMEAFTDGGPMSGTRKHAGLMLASSDRIALDAVGIAILKMLGSNRDIMSKHIFAQEQIARAVELGLGASGPGEIDIVAAPDDASREAARRIGKILAEG